MTSPQNPTTARQIARAAGQILRDAHDRGPLRTKTLDWGAISSVHEAAIQAGFVEPLDGWVPHAPGLSLTAYSEAFLARYAEAYGPVNGLDVAR